LESLSCGFDLDKKSFEWSTSLQNLAFSMENYGTDKMMKDGVHII